MESVDIAVLLTCHNRKEKTIACLRSLFLSQDDYNNSHDNQLLLNVFLVDDGCTDGTSDEIRRFFLNKMDVISIINGDGNLYWAGGMRVAWRSSLEMRNDWDFYLLLNDDTTLYDYCFDLLFQTHKFSLEKYGKAGIYSGGTCEGEYPEKVSYGGVKWKNRVLAKSIPLKPMGEPQMCDAANANILFISNKAFKDLGIFYDGYQHGYADYEYTMLARKKDIPVLLTSHLAGECANDHRGPKNIIMKMSLRERKNYFKSPLHSNKDHLLFFYRNFPLRLPSVIVGRILWLYFPTLYYKIQRVRLDNEKVVNL